MIIMAARLYVNFVRHSQHDTGMEANPYDDDFGDDDDDNVSELRLRRQAILLQHL